jgi:hypothetical protein
MNFYWCFSCRNCRRDTATNKNYCPELVDYLSSEVWMFTRNMGCTKYKINIEKCLFLGATKKELRLAGEL